MEDIFSHDEITEICSSHDEITEICLQTSDLDTVADILCYTISLFINGLIALISKAAM